MPGPSAPHSSVHPIPPGEWKEWSRPLCVRACARTTQWSQVVVDLGLPPVNRAKLQPRRCSGHGLPFLLCLQACTSWLPPYAPCATRQRKHGGSQAIRAGAGLVGVGNSDLSVVSGCSTVFERRAMSRYPSIIAAPVHVDVAQFLISKANKKLKCGHFLPWTRQCIPERKEARD